jgi:hypothetical protein
MTRDATIPRLLEAAMQFIRQLPDDTTLDEIWYYLYVRQKVRRAI